MDERSAYLSFSEHNVTLHGGNSTAQLLLLCKRAVEPWLRLSILCHNLDTRPSLDQPTPGNESFDTSCMSDSPASPVAFRKMSRSAYSCRRPVIPEAMSKPAELFT